MFRFSFGRRMEEQALPALLALPPRGGSLIAEVRADRIETLAAALIDGAALEVGVVRAVRVAVGLFLIETGHGSLFARDAVEAVSRLLEFDQHATQFAV